MLFYKIAKWWKQTPLEDGENPEAVIEVGHWFSAHGGDVKDLELGGNLWLKFGQ